VTALPFSSVGDYARRLEGLVPDAKAATTDEEFIEDAVRGYASDNPLWDFVDVGDGSLFEWQLGVAPFDSFELGYSDRYPLTVEELDVGAIQYRPPQFLRSQFDVRSRANAEKWLVFDVVPAAANQVRVGYRTQYAAGAIPVYHQMAVVYLAAAAKCSALATYYRSTVDDVGGSDVFAADPAGDSYERSARAWTARARRLLAKSVTPQFTSGTVFTGRRHIFNREIP